MNSNERKIIVLSSYGHFLSHFYMLIFPSLHGAYDSVQRRTPFCIHHGLCFLFGRHAAHREQPRSATYPGKAPFNQLRHQIHLHLRRWVIVCLRSQTPYRALQLCARLLAHGCGYRMPPVGRGGSRLSHQRREAHELVPRWPECATEAYLLSSPPLYQAE